MVARSVEAALGADHVREVFVSSDDADILEEGRRAGAHPLERPASLASDTATSEAALLHAIDEVSSAGNLPEVLVFMQCTSPFTTSPDVDGVVAAIEDGADCAMTVAPFHHFVWEATADGRAVAPVGHDKDSRARRQDGPIRFLETGAVYAMRVEGFRQAGHRFFGRVGHHVVDAARSIEIDDEADLRMALAIERSFPEIASR